MVLAHLGYRRIKEYYQDELGVVVSENKIKRVMNIICYKAKSKYNYNSYNKNYKNQITNKQNYYKNQIIKNIIKEGFSPDRPNFVWAVDGHEIYKKSDRRVMMNIIAIIDSFDQSIISYAFSDGSNHKMIFRDLFLKTIESHGKPLIIHSDNG